MIPKYSRPEMARVWSTESKLDQWLAVEIAVCEAWAELGVVPREALAEIRSARYDVDRIAQLEAETQHDVTAFLGSVSESIGDRARYIHLGLTSSDIIDTGLALQIRDATRILRDDLDHLLAVLEAQALKYKDLPMVGRTHGVHAEPTTLGLKLAVWIDELRRGRARLDFAAEQLAVGKISGAVGTHATVPPEVEEVACARLGLRPAPVSTQIIQRDRHAQYLTTLAVIAASLEKMATEIRALQRTEVREVEEPFGSGQHGSSAMPHKRNPILSERVVGLARVIRGHAATALENVALWHERDISHSSAERIIFPDACGLLDYMLQLMAKIVGNLRVHPERMAQNLAASYGLIFSQRVLLALIERGLSREQAYRVVQRDAMRAWDEQRSFRDILRADAEVTTVLGPDELDSLFDIRYFLRHVDVAFRRLGLLPHGRLSVGTTGKDDVEATDKHDVGATGDRPTNTIDPGRGRNVND